MAADKNSLVAAKSLGGLHVKSLKNDTGTAGSCASHDAGTAGSPASHDGFKIGTSFARCEGAGTGVKLNVKDQSAILDRLIQILSKQTVSVQTKNGPVEDEVTADKNSIAAAKLMIGIQAKYQKHGKEDADIVRLNENDQTAIVERLMQILSKRTVIVQTRNGPVEDRLIADKNALTSANLLTGTAGLSASQDGFKIGESPARCETNEALITGEFAGRHAPGTAGLSASDNGFKIGKSFARGESDEVPITLNSQSRT